MTSNTFSRRGLYKITFTSLECRPSGWAVAASEGRVVFLFLEGKLAQPTYITRDGLVRLQAELDDHRTTRRQEVADRIQRANAMGGTVDNAEYDEAKKEQAFIEGRILDLEAIINNSAIIEATKKPSDTVEVGSKVTVINSLRKKKEKFFIVGSPEADPPQGKISNVSPIGKALIGKRVGEIAEINAPAGTINLKILEIK